MRKLLAVLLFVAALAPMIARAQGCTNPVCAAKAMAYSQFMGLILNGSEPGPLPLRYRQVLQRFYPGNNLDSVMVAFAPSIKSRQQNMTDCNIIYVGDPDFATRVKNAMVTSPVEQSVLYHELQHTVQCAALGSWELYAERWFNEAGAGFGQEAWMPMEIEAAAKARDVMAALPNGIFPPVKMTSLSSSPGTRVDASLPLTWTANASGGTGGGFEFEFAVRKPGAADFLVEQAFSDSNTFSRPTRTTPPFQVGTFGLQVTARDKMDTSMAHDAKLADFIITLPPPPAPSMISDVPSPQRLGKSIWWFASPPAHVHENHVEFEFEVTRSPPSSRPLNRIAGQPFGVSSAMQWTPNEPGTYRVALRVRYRAQDGVPPGPVTEIFSPWFEITDRRVIRRADRPSDKAGTAIVVKPKPDLNLGPKPTPPTR